MLDVGNLDKDEGGGHDHDGGNSESGRGFSPVCNEFLDTAYPYAFVSFERSGKTSTKTMVPAHSTQLMDGM